MKVIFRKDNKSGDVIAFLPEIQANPGNIMSYMHIGQHDEASLGYYYDTVKAEESEYKQLLIELQGIYNPVQLVVKQRMNYSDLKNAWK